MATAEVGGDTRHKARTQRAQGMEPEVVLCV